MPEERRVKRKRTSSRTSLFGAVVATEETETDFSGHSVPELTQVLASLVGELITVAYGPQTSDKLRSTSRELILSSMLPDKQPMSAEQK